MKHLLLIFALLPVISMAQNGGQSDQNSFGKLEFVAYQNGFYYVSQRNKQSCSVRTKFSWLNKDTTIVIAGNTTATIKLPGQAVNGLRIKSKPLDRCDHGGGDLGWLEISAPCALPLKVNYFHGTLINSNQLKAELSVSDVEEGDNATLNVSFDGVNYNPIGILFPDGDGVYTLLITRKYTTDNKPYFTYSLIKLTKQ